MLVQTEYEGMPVNIILDGKIVYENLASAKLTVEKLKNKLQEEELSVKDVFYASIDAKGEYYIQTKEI